MTLNRSPQLGFVGGLLLISSAIALAFYLIIEGLGVLVGAGGAIVSSILSASFLCEGIGAALVGLAAPPPLDGRASRVGLGLLAIGLLGAVLAGFQAFGSSVLAGQAIWAVASAVFLGSTVGTLIIGLSLVRLRGLPSGIGFCLLASIVPIVVGPIGDAIGLAGPLWAAVHVAGVVTSVVGVAGLGILAINGVRLTRESRTYERS